MTEAKGDLTMSSSRDDILSVEAATDLLVRGLNRADISSITDLVMATTLLLPPARRTSRRQAVIEAWGNLAMGQEGIGMMSTHMDTVAEGMIRDVGTLSMRLRQSGERNLFRYVVFWQRVGADPKLATMSWNREPPAGGRQKRGQGADGSATEM